MRRVGLSDLDLAARVVMQIPDDHQLDFARNLIDAAHIADKWRKKHGRFHPSGAGGSLYGQAALVSRAPAGQGGARYHEAFAVVLQALHDWRGRLNCAR